MISILSLVTSIKDYVEIVHKLIETDNSFGRWSGIQTLIPNYFDLGSIITYTLISFKEFLTNFISLNWFWKIFSFFPILYDSGSVSGNFGLSYNSIWSLAIVIPDINSAMISEISVLDGYFHNTFNFLDKPISYGDTNITIYSLEKFSIGLINSLFLCLPTGTTHLITLRRFIMQGLEAGYLAGLGSICGNILWISSIIFGFRFFVVPWLSLDIFRYVLGFICLIKYMWDSYNERGETSNLKTYSVMGQPKKDVLPSQVRSNTFPNQIDSLSLSPQGRVGVDVNKQDFNGGVAESIFTPVGDEAKKQKNKNPLRLVRNQKIFLLNFILALTEQTSIYPFMTNISIGSESSLLESFPAQNNLEFLSIHGSYILGLTIGCLSFLHLTCWFWENPAFKFYMWLELLTRMGKWLTSPFSFLASLASHILASRGKGKEGHISLPFPQERSGTGKVFMSPSFSFFSSAKDILREGTDQVFNVWKFLRPSGQPQPPKGNTNTYSAPGGSRNTFPFREGSSLSPLGDVWGKASHQNQIPAGFPLWGTGKEIFGEGTSFFYYKILNFIFLYLTMICAISSIPYYGLDYTLTNPLGFIQEDRILDQKLILETSFLNTKASDRNTRRNRGRHGRRERWKRRIRKYRTFDASLYDQGIYDLFTIEDLNYGFDRFWLRRKMRNHRVRFRFFPGPWMRSFKKQLAKPRLESYAGPRQEFFRILFEQVYHPSFHEYLNSTSTVSLRGVDRNTYSVMGHMSHSGRDVFPSGMSQSEDRNTPSTSSTKLERRDISYFATLRKYAQLRDPSISIYSATPPSGDSSEAGKKGSPTGTHISSTSSTKFSGAKKERRDISRLRRRNLAELKKKEGSFFFFSSVATKKKKEAKKQKNEKEGEDIRSLPFGNVPLKEGTFRFYQSGSLSGPELRIFPKGLAPYFISEGSQKNKIEPDGSYRASRSISLAELKNEKESPAKTRGWSAKNREVFSHKYQVAQQKGQPSTIAKESSTLRKFVRKINNRTKRSEILSNLRGRSFGNRYISLSWGESSVYSKRWKENFSFRLRPFFPSSSLRENMGRKNMFQTKISHGQSHQVNKFPCTPFEGHSSIFDTSSLRENMACRIKDISRRGNTEAILKANSKISLSKIDKNILKYRSILAAGFSSPYTELLGTGYMPGVYLLRSKKIKNGVPEVNEEVWTSDIKSSPKTNPMGNMERSLRNMNIPRYSRSEYLDTQDGKKGYVPPYGNKNEKEGTISLGGNTLGGLPSLLSRNKMEISKKEKTNNSLYLLHPIKFYLKKQQAFERKLRYYTPTIFRKFSIENNAPYFRVMMKRYFYYFKPTLRWERTMKVASLRKARRKTSVSPRKIQLSQLSPSVDEVDAASTAVDPSRSEKEGGYYPKIASRLALDLHPKENDKFSSASRLPLPYGSQSKAPSFLRSKGSRVIKTTHNYTIVGKRASRFRYEIYKDVLQHWYYSPFNRLLLKFDIDLFINRQPKSHFLTKNEEKLLHLRRFLLSEHYNTLRWYSYMQHYRSMKNKIGGTKSFASKVYNQQFSGTFKKIRHLFAITPSQSNQPVLKFDQPLYNESSVVSEAFRDDSELTILSSDTRKSSDAQNKGPDVANAGTIPLQLQPDRGRLRRRSEKERRDNLSFFGPLPFGSRARYTLQHPQGQVTHKKKNISLDILHEELYVPGAYNNRKTSKVNESPITLGISANLNQQANDNPPPGALGGKDFLRSFSGGTSRFLPGRRGQKMTGDLLQKSTQTVGTYLKNSSSTKQYYIKNLIKNKNYVKLTQFLYQGQKTRGLKPITNEHRFLNQEKQYLLTDLSPNGSRRKIQDFQGVPSGSVPARRNRPKETAVSSAGSFGPALPVGEAGSFFFVDHSRRKQDLWVNLLKKWKRKVNDQEFLKNYLQRRIEKREKRKKKKEKNLKTKLERLENWDVKALRIINSSYRPYTPREVFSLSNPPPQRGNTFPEESLLRPFGNRRRLRRADSYRAERAIKSTTGLNNAFIEGVYILNSTSLHSILFSARYTPSTTSRQVTYSLDFVDEARKKGQKGILLPLLQRERDRKNYKIWQQKERSLNKQKRSRKEFKLFTQRMTPQTRTEATYGVQNKNSNFFMRLAKKSDLSLNSYPKGYASHKTTSGDNKGMYLDPDLKKAALPLSSNTSRGDVESLNLKKKRDFLPDTRLPYPLHSIFDDSIFDRGRRSRRSENEDGNKERNGTPAYIPPGRSAIRIGKKRKKRDVDFASHREGHLQPEGENTSKINETPAIPYGGKEKFGILSRIGGRFASPNRLVNLTTRKFKRKKSPQRRARVRRNRGVTKKRTLSDSLKREFKNLRKYGSQTKLTTRRKSFDPGVNSFLATLRKYAQDKLPIFSLREEDGKKGHTSPLLESPLGRQGSVLYHKNVSKESFNNSYYEAMSKIYLSLGGYQKEKSYSLLTRSAAHIYPKGLFVGVEDIEQKRKESTPSFSLPGKLLGFLPLRYPHWGEVFISRTPLLSSFARGIQHFFPKEYFPGGSGLQIKKGVIFRQNALLLQRRSKQKKQRFWKQKRSKYSQKLRKYKKRRRSVLGKVRILTKQLKRIQSTTELKNWWWKKFLPNLRATTDSLLQFEKDRQIKQKLLELTVPEIPFGMSLPTGSERDKIYDNFFLPSGPPPTGDALNIASPPSSTTVDEKEGGQVNKLPSGYKGSVRSFSNLAYEVQIGDFDFKPLSMPASPTPQGNIPFFSSTTVDEGRPGDFSGGENISSFFATQGPELRIFPKGLAPYFISEGSQKNKIEPVGLYRAGSLPFYAGWDDSLRKFVVTNRLLSRRTSGYEVNKYTKGFLPQREATMNIPIFSLREYLDTQDGKKGLSLPPTGKAESIFTPVGSAEQDEAKKQKNKKETNHFPPLGEMSSIYPRDILPCSAKPTGKKQGIKVFSEAPLKGMNAATTLYWQIPFTTYDPDQFFALGMDGFAPLGWRRFQFRHSILKSWLHLRERSKIHDLPVKTGEVSLAYNFLQTPTHTVNPLFVRRHLVGSSDSTAVDEAKKKGEYILKSPQGDISRHPEYTGMGVDFVDAPTGIAVVKSPSFILADSAETLRKGIQAYPTGRKQNLTAKPPLWDNFNLRKSIPANIIKLEGSKSVSRNIYRRLKKRYKRVKKHPRSPVWFPSGPLLNQVLPVHYIYIFYKRSRLPRDRYIKRRLRKSKPLFKDMPYQMTPQKGDSLSGKTVNTFPEGEPALRMSSHSKKDKSKFGEVFMLGEGYLSVKDFTLRKRIKTKRKYHIKPDFGISSSKKNNPGDLSPLIPRRLKFLGNSTLRWRPLSRQKINKPISELIKEQRALKYKQRKKYEATAKNKQSSANANLRIKQLRRRVQRQIIRSVWRYNPRAGGFVWPGDYLKLEQVKAPRLKSTSISTLRVRSDHTDISAPALAEKEKARFDTSVTGLPKQEEGTGTASVSRSFSGSPTGGKIGSAGVVAKQHSIPAKVKRKKKRNIQEWQIQPKKYLLEKHNLNAIKKKLEKANRSPYQVKNKNLLKQKI